MGSHPVAKMGNRVRKIFILNTLAKILHPRDVGAVSTGAPNLREGELASMTRWNRSSIPKLMDSPGGTSSISRICSQ
jgi:hypothetical protein